MSYGVSTARNFSSLGGPEDGPEGAQESGKEQRADISRLIADKAHILERAFAFARSASATDQQAIVSGVLEHDPREGLKLSSLLGLTQRDIFPLLDKHIGIKHPETMHDLCGVMHENEDFVSSSETKAAYREYSIDIEVSSGSYGADFTRRFINRPARIGSPEAIEITKEIDAVYTQLLRGRKFTTVQDAPSGTPGSRAAERYLGKVGVLLDKPYYTGSVIEALWKHIVVNGNAEWLAETIEKYWSTIQSEVPEAATCNTPSEYVAIVRRQSRPPRFIFSLTVSRHAGLSSFYEEGMYTRNLIEDRLVQDILRKVKKAAQQPGVTSGIDIQSLEQALNRGRYRALAPLMHIEQREAERKLKKEIAGEMKALGYDERFFRIEQNDQGFWHVAFTKPSDREIPALSARGIGARALSFGKGARDMIASAQSYGTLSDQLGAELFQGKEPNIKELVHRIDNVGGMHLTDCFEVLISAGRRDLVRQLYDQYQFLHTVPGDNTREFRRMLIALDESDRLCHCIHPNPRGYYDFKSREEIEYLARHNAPFLRTALHEFMEGKTLFIPGNSWEESSHALTIAELLNDSGAARAIAKKKMTKELDSSASRHEFLANFHDHEHLERHVEVLMNHGEQEMVRALLRESVAHNHFSHACISAWALGDFAQASEMLRKISDESKGYFVVTKSIKAVLLNDPQLLETLFQSAVSNGHVFMAQKLFSLLELGDHEPACVRATQYDALMRAIDASPHTVSHIKAPAAIVHGDLHTAKAALVEQLEEHDGDLIVAINACKEKTAELSRLQRIEEHLILLNVVHPAANIPIDRWRTWIRTRVNGSGNNNQRTVPHASPRVVNFLNELLRDAPEMFIDSLSPVTVPPSKGELEEFIFDLFPEIPRNKRYHAIRERIRRVYTNAVAQMKSFIPSGDTTQKTGPGNESKILETMASAMSSMWRRAMGRSTEKYDGGGVDTLLEPQRDMLSNGGDPRKVDGAPEILTLRNPTGEIEVLTMFGKCDPKQNYWQKLTTSVTPELEEPVVERTKEVHLAPGMRTINLPRMVGSELIKERVRGITAEGQEVEVACTVDASGAAVVRTDRDLEEIIYSERRSALPIVPGDITIEELERHKKQFRTHHGDILEASLGALPAECTVFVSSIAHLSPKEKIYAIEQFVRDVGYYDFDNGETIEGKKKLSIAERFQYMGRRADTLRDRSADMERNLQGKLFAGVCEDFDKLTIAMLRSAGFLAGSLSCLRPSPDSKAVTAAALHACSYVLLPGKDGDRVVPVDGTPEGVTEFERATLRQLVQPLLSIKEKMRAIAKEKAVAEAQEALAEVKGNVEKYDAERIRSLKNGELETMVNTLLQHTVTQRDVAIVTSLLDIDYAPLPKRLHDIDPSDFNDRRMIDEVIGSVMKLGQLQHEEGRDRDHTAPGGGELLALIAERARRLVRGGAVQSSSEALDVLENLVTVGKRHLSEQQYRASIAAITYLKANRMRGGKAL